MSKQKSSKSSPGPITKSIFKNTYNMFDNSWHPLSEEGLESFKCNDFTGKAVSIIEHSQKIWNCGPSDERFKLAQEIWEIIVPFSKRYFPVFPDLANPPLVDVLTVPQKCRDVISEVRNHTEIDNGNISDYEIAALFAINWACKVLNDHKCITEASLEMEANLMFLNSDMHMAKTILGWAKQVQSKQDEYTGEETASENNVFYWNNGVWRIGLKGKTPIMRRDYVGLGYIHYLMRNKKEYVANLRNIIRGKPKYERDRARLLKKNEYRDENRGEDFNTKKKRKYTNEECDDTIVEYIFQCIEDINEIKDLENINVDKESDINDPGNYERIHSEEIMTKMGKIEEILQALLQEKDTVNAYLNQITKIVELEQKLENENTGSLRDEIEELRKKLSKNLRNHFQVSDKDNTVKQAYNSVSGSISNSLDKIAEVDEELAEYLRTRINYSDKMYFFNEKEDVEWIL